MTTSRGAPLQLGFIGGSLRSAVGQAHYCAATMDHRWHVAAGCFSRTGDINHATGAAYGVAEGRVYRAWRAMIAAEAARLDAVCVLTPTPSHAEIVAGCLAAGVPVICEKALCASSAQARQLGALRDRHRGFLAVTYNYSGYPMVRELRHLIRAGGLGRLLKFHIEMPQEGFIRTDAAGRRPTPQAWRLHDGFIPTIYLDLAVHVHHLLHYLTASHPLRAVAAQHSHGWFADLVDDVNCLCRYSDGLSGHIWFSKSALGYRNGLRVRLFGTAASAEWHQANPEELLLSHASGRREILDRGGDLSVAAQHRYGRFKPGHPAGFIEAFANLYGDIATALLAWRETGTFHSDELFSAELAAEGLGFLEALCASAATGQWKDIVPDALHEAA